MTWIVARKFAFQCFAFSDSKANGTVNVEAAERCVPATAFLAADHLGQLIVTDAMPREGACRWTRRAEGLMCGAAASRSSGARGVNWPARSHLEFEDTRAWLHPGRHNARVDSWSPDDQRMAFGKAVWRLHSTIFAPYRVWAEHQRMLDFPEGQIKSVWDGPLHGHHQAVAGLLDLCAYFCLWTEAANLRHMPECLWFLFWCATLIASGALDILPVVMKCLPWLF